MIRLNFIFYRHWPIATGCGQCQGLGYRGRIGIHEALEMDDSLRAVLGANELNEFREMAGRQLEGRRLIDGALDLAFAGETTLDEVARVVGVSDSAALEKDFVSPALALSA